MTIASDLAGIIRQADRRQRDDQRARYWSLIRAGPDAVRAELAADAAGFRRLLADLGHEPEHVDAHLAADAELGRLIAADAAAVEQIAGARAEQDSAAAAEQEAETALRKAKEAAAVAYARHVAALNQKNSRMNRLAELRGQFPELFSKEIRHE
jgi:predicted glycoside hydrolase/deacetylase ChbG (UPF0249 family)